MWACTIFSSASTAPSVVRPVAIRSCSRQRAVDTRRDSGKATILSRRIDMRTNYRRVMRLALGRIHVNPSLPAGLECRGYPLIKEGFLVTVHPFELGLGHVENHSGDASTLF